MGTFSGKRGFFFSSAYQSEVATTCYHLCLPFEDVKSRGTFFWLTLYYIKGVPLHSLSIYQLALNGVIIFV